LPANDSARLNTRSQSDRESACERLERAVEHVQRRLVPELAERLGDFVLDFLLVERSRQGAVTAGVPSSSGSSQRVVEDEAVERSPRAENYKLALL
jgi:hypothetical protein